jgi:acetyl esterase/lipase
MKRVVKSGWLVAALVGLMASTVNAQQLPSYIERPSDAAGVFAIWPSSGVPPGSEKWTWHEQSIQLPGSSKVPNRMVRNVVIPTVTMYKPAPGKANGTALIVAPGGAFNFLMLDIEGYETAHWLAQHGVTAFVLRYRVAHTPENDAEFGTFVQNLLKVLPHPDPTVETPPMVGDNGPGSIRSMAEDDARQAIRFVRQHAAQWGIDPKRIGISGFSAGGGLAVEAAMHHDASSRPDFVAGLYPGYRTATPVPADAPPLFIAATDDDRFVSPVSGAKLYEAWHKAGKSAELHIFVRGEHGFGMKKQDLPSDSWIELLKNWLTVQGLLSPVTK